MIQKENRFTRRSAIRGVFRYGESVRCSQISINYKRKDQTHPNRYAVTVSTSVAKSAVARNRIRRRLYEFIREHQNHFISGVDIVLVVHEKTVAQTPMVELEQKLLGCLKSANILQS